MTVAGGSLTFAKSSGPKVRINSSLKTFANGEIVFVQEESGTMDFVG